MTKLLILDSRGCRQAHIDVLNDLSLVMTYPSMTGQKVGGGGVSQCGSPPEKLRLFLTRFPPSPAELPAAPSNHMLPLSSWLRLCVVVF